MSRQKESRSSKQRDQDRTRSSGSISSNGSRRGSPAITSGRQAVEDFRQGAHHAAQSVRDSIHDAQGMITAKYEEAVTSATGAADAVKGRIARNPAAALGIAAGVGIIIGMSIGRPRS